MKVLSEINLHQSAMRNIIPLVHAFIIKTNKISNE